MNKREFVKWLEDNTIKGGYVLHETEYMMEIQERKTETVYEVHKDNVIRNWRECYTVTYIDPFLSGWGCAKDKANKVFIICDNWNEAQIIKQRLLTQSTIKRASVSSGIPRFSREADYISIKTKVNCPEGWWWRDIIHEENGDNRYDD